MPRSTILILTWSILSWAALISISRALLVSLEFDPWMFTFLQLASGGVFLLLISKGTEAGLSALRRFDTWLVGAFRVGTGALMMSALVHVNAMQVGLIGAVNVPMSVIGVYFLFARKPGMTEIWGHLILLAGAAAVAVGLDSGLANPAITLLVLSQVCVVVSSLLAERHPHMNALDQNTRLRLTGIVLLVTALFFAGLRLLQAGMAPGLGLDTRTLQDLAHPGLWLAGIGLGISLRGLSTYLGFRAAALAGTQNYLMAVMSLPFISILFEYCLAGFGLGQWPEVGQADLIGGVFVVVGGVAIAVLRKSYGLKNKAAA